MSTGKRLAKRSIVGTRVCARGDDGKYYAATIQAIKTPASSFMDQHQNTNCIHLTPNTRYTVLFDRTTGYEGRDTAEFFESELIGPGFQTIMGLELLPGQRCYVTHNGREVSGMVTRHYVNSDDVLIEIYLPGCTEQPFLVHKRLEEVRLLESRKSARLADTDTDFARLADMGSERKRQASNTIDVPLTSTSSQIGSRKRRPSNSQDDIMDECSAAMVLMSLSISPHHQYLQQQQPFQQQMGTSPESAICSGSGSNRSTPSPASRGDSPQNVYASSYDDGIDMEMEEQPKRKKRVAFRCTWPNCMVTSSTLSSIEYHVRNEHDVGTGELLEFYYNEVEVDPTSSPSTVNHNHHHSAPTLSHRDMARPPHEDPDYQRQLVGSYRQSLLSSSPGSGPQSPYKVLRLTTPHHHHQSPHTIVGGLNHPTITTAVAAASPPLTKTPASPRRVRGENKKCRKNYGMENRDQWCTSCRWKKACTRFADILGDQRLVKTVSYTSSGSSLQHQQQQHQQQQQQQQNPSVCSL